MVTTERAGFTAELLSKAAFPLAAPAIASNNRAFQRGFPHLLLPLALNRASTLRWLAQDEYEGRRQDVLTFADSDGSQLTLYFDEQSGLLTKTEGLSDNFFKGLAASETIFSRYRHVNGFQMPFRVVSKLGGEVTTDLAYLQVKFNSTLDDSLFEMPKGLEVGPEVGGPPKTLTLTRLATDIYYVNGVDTGSIFFYGSLFVVFRDYVLVIEAPLSEGLTQAVIAKIKETVPGKPIKYLVSTHYHLDHLGGVRGYIAEGASIVTTPANRRLIESIASVTHPLNPDKLSVSMRQVSVETLQGKRVFTDGEHVLELHNVGPTPHADEVILAYFPQEKIAFITDLFPVYFKGRGPADPSNLFLEQKIRELGLNIETIASGHGRLGTMDELRQAIKMKETQAAKP